MIISEKFLKELLSLKNDIDNIIENGSITDMRLENFLKNFEKTRYNIINELKLYNNNVQYEYEKIKTVDNEYKAELKNGILRIYIPEVMMSYKNLKTHTHKRILLNVAEITKSFAGCFGDEVFIYIKVFDKILGWDIDNKFIKPISDGLILSKVIKDDNISNMFYCAKGEFSEKPHTEVYIFDGKNMSKFLESTVDENRENR